MLEKYLDKLTDGKSGLSIFVPLCGKSVDLKWLADKGYKVFGVEASELAVSQLFKEADLSPKITPFDVNSKLYEACDGRLKVVAGDIFYLNRNNCGLFDCVWSKNSFGSINPHQRDWYVRVITQLLEPQGRVLHCSLFYEREDSTTGPPFPASTELIKSKYSLYFNIEFLESVEWTKPEVMKDLKATSNVNQVYHFLRKIDYNLMISQLNCCPEPDLFS